MYLQMFIYIVNIRSMCINVHIYLILPVEEYTYSASDADFASFAPFSAAMQGLLGDFASLAEVELLPLGWGIEVWQPKKNCPREWVLR